MALSRAQRSRINRQNAQHSTGPRTDEGKARSRMNALKHGLRAETLALPDEDPAELAQREQQWLEFYRPQNPAELYLVHQAVRATIQLDRCARFQTVVLTRQVRAALAALEPPRDEAIAPTLVEAQHPGRMIQRLLGSAAGCRWLIARWTELRDALGASDGWSDERLAMARALCRTACDEMWFEPEWVETLRNAPYSRFDTEQARAQDGLSRAIAHAQRIEAEHRAREVDPGAAARAEAASASALIADEPTARRHLRYQTTAQSAFFRAYAALTKAREARDDEPEEWPDAPERVEAPNEPNEAEGPAQVAGEPSGSDDPPAADPGPPAAPEPIAEGARRCVIEPPAPASERNGTEVVASDPKPLSWLVGLIGLS